MMFSFRLPLLLLIQVTGFIILSQTVLCQNAPGYLDSDLSDVGDNGRRFDLVVGVTQKSVSATMKRYLQNIQQPPFKQIFVVDENAADGEPKFIPKDFDQAKAFLGFDPFTIPDGTTLPDERISKMAANGYLYGFMAEFGNPDIDQSRIPDPITFDRSGSDVTYNMVMREFKAFEISRGAGLFAPVGINIISQSDFLAQDPTNKPWQFQFAVDLDLRTDSVTNQFHLLPPRTQQLVKNLGVNIFSIQQLFLNLNTAQLQNKQPSIPNLEPTSVLAILLQTVFLRAYLQTIDQSGDGILLGYTVSTSHPVPHEATLVPTNLNIHISPYKFANGSDTTNFPLYSLNYLIASQNRLLPAPVDFSWNWITESEADMYDGVVAVRRNVFRDFLKETLSPKLKTICLIPNVDVRIDDPVVAHFAWGVSQCAVSPEYTALDGGSNGKILHYSSHSRAYDSDTFVPLWGNMALDVYSSSEIFFSGNMINTVSSVRVHGRVNVLGGVTSGNLVYYKTMTNYELSVDAGGRISVKLQDGSPKFEDLSDNIDANGWSNFISVGQVDDLIDKIVNSVQGLRNFLTGFDKQIGARLNSGADWVFPGGNTFAFRDVSFSKHLDLVSHISYVDPIDSA